MIVASELVSKKQMTMMPLRLSGVTGRPVFPGTITTATTFWSVVEIIVYTPWFFLASSSGCDGTLACAKGALSDKVL